MSRVVDAYVKADRMEQDAQKLRLAVAFSRHPLDRGDTWPNGEGKKWRLEDMEPRHRRNVMRYLERNAEAYFYNHDIETGVSNLAMGCDSMPDEVLEPDPIYGSKNPQDFIDWIHGTKLFQALRDLEDFGG